MDGASGEPAVEGVGSGTGEAGESRVATEATSRAPRKPRGRCSPAAPRRTCSRGRTAPT